MFSGILGTYFYKWALLLTLFCADQAINYQDYQEGQSWQRQVPVAVIVIGLTVAMLGEMIADYNAYYSEQNPPPQPEHQRTLEEVNREIDQLMLDLSNLEDATFHLLETGQFRVPPPTRGGRRSTRNNGRITSSSLPRGQRRTARSHSPGRPQRPRINRAAEEVDPTSPAPSSPTFSLSWLFPSSAP